MSSIIESALSLFEGGLGRTTVCLTGLVVVGSGAVYLIHSWRKDRWRRKELSRRRNTVELRKPPELWNTAIFFPDYHIQQPNSKTSQLLWYFKEAKISIQICIYNCSLRDLEQVLVQKHDEGLLVEVITAHEGTAKAFREGGIRVGLYPQPDKEFLMHHKFVIFDGEAVMTGSLNWTLDGIVSNRENVVISTDQRHVKKYVQEFYKLSKVCEDAKTIY